MKKFLSKVETLVGLILQFIPAQALWSASEDIPIWLVVVLWVAGSVLFADGLRRVRRVEEGVEGEEEEVPLVFWIFLSLALFLPVYGPIGGLLMEWLRRRRGSEETGLIDEYVDYIGSEESEPEETEAVGGSVEEMVFEEMSIQSYTDIVRGPNRNLKKALISKILQEWTPGSISLLKIALRDEVYEIRSYASTALTTIEDRMNRSIQEVKRELAEDIDDVVVQFKLARCYLNYAESGLLDDSSKHHYAKLAGEAVSRVGEDDRDLFIDRLSAEMRALRLQDLTEEEFERCNRILDLRPDHQEALGRLCEIQFDRRDFGSLSESCRRFLAVTPEDHPATEGARLWAGERAIEVST